MLTIALEDVVPVVLRHDDVGGCSVSRGLKFLHFTLSFIVSITLGLLSSLFFLSNELLFEASVEFLEVRTGSV